MAQQGLWERFKNNVTTAISDVREKVVEEGWFGRATAPQESMAVKLGWEQRGPKPDTVTVDTTAPPASRTINLPAGVAADVAKASAALKPLSWEEIRSDMREVSPYAVPDHAPDKDQGLDR